VVIVTRQSAVEVRSILVVAEVTTRVRRLQTEVALGAEEGLPRPCVVNADALRTVSKSRLLKRYGHLSSAKLDALDAALRFSLGLD
jgi:mRNA interferase MazF